MTSSTLLAAAAAAPRRRRQPLGGRPLRSVKLHLSVFASLPLPPERDWAELPPDLISAVFHRLGPVQIMLAADKVCRSWRRAARDEPDLWRRVDMRGCRELSSRDLVDLDKMAVDAVLRSQGQCEAFCGEGSDVNDDFLRFLADQAPLLKTLILTKCEKVSEQGFLRAIKRFPQLEELELSKCWRTYHQQGILKVVAKACPKLKHLRHGHFCPYYQFEYEDRDDSEAMVVATMHELRSLQLYHNKLTIKGLVAILDNCLKLESLDLRDCHGIDMNDTIRAKCAKIKTVKLLMSDTHGESQNFDPGFPISECSTCRDYFGHIKRYYYNHYVCDQRTMVVATVHELRSLLIDRGDLTNQGVSAILEKWPRLESLDIRNCYDIIMKNTLPAKRTRIKTKKLTIKLLRDPYDLKKLNPEALDISYCRNIIMNSYWYKRIIDKGFGARYNRIVLKKRISNYHRKNKKLLAKQIEEKFCFEGTGKRHPYYTKSMDFDSAELELRYPTSECSTCLMFEYFTQHWDDLDDNDYADYYDHSYGLDRHDETDFQVLDRMVGKKSRRYLKMDENLQIWMFS
ncbi:hypothetical protein ACP70R_031448 [Stipagrostis hirtigluma subsp. patula]